MPHSHLMSPMLKPALHLSIKCDMVASKDVWPKTVRFCGGGGNVNMSSEMID